MRKFFISFVIYASFCFYQQAQTNPEQIHISLGQTPDYMTVNWATIDPKIIPKSEVQWGLSEDNLDNKALGDVRKFTDSGSEKRVIYIHLALMINLQPSKTYYYRVGDSEYGYSKIFKFKSAPNKETLKSELPILYGVWGDMGTVNQQTLDLILNETRNNNFDVAIHVGDFAYDMHEDNGRNADKFMNLIQDCAANVPYMVCHGNHENTYNQSHYTERFRGQPNNSGTVWTNNGEAPNNWWFSWNHGLVHFVVFSTEVYFEWPDLIQQQYEWIKKDLEKANQNRTEAPWIIVYGHRSMYCSCDEDCDKDAQIVRDGQFGLEKLLYDFGVDIFINGHEHNYERMYDILKNKTTRTTINPPSTVYIVTGAAGSREGHEKFTRPEAEWDAFRQALFGYSKMYVYNNTHIFWEQIETDTSDKPHYGKIVDSTWIVQENHGPFNYHPKSTFQHKISANIIHHN